MIITKIEPITKTKYKVYVEEQFAFILYKGELVQYHLKENSEITETIIHEIMETVLLKRAKRRAMYLLNEMSRTENQLREKLRCNGYPEEVINGAVAYVKSFGYINDESYVRNFVENRKAKKSRREIAALLSQKGLNEDMTNAILEEIYQDYSEREAIGEILRKKRWDLPKCSDKEKQKIYGYLVRKGFYYEDIRKVIEER